MGVEKGGDNKVKIGAKWLWIQQQFGLGTIPAHNVLLKYPKADDIINLTADEISAERMFTDTQKTNIAKKNFTSAEKIIENSAKLGINIITIEDREYPERLRNIYSPPLILFYKGDVSLLNEVYHISMVGTRTPDNYGAETANTLSYNLAKAGVVIVSGLAVGIDITCHKGAIAANGKTIGVAACGLDVNYPTANKDVREEIGEKHLLISEFIIGSLAAPFHFPVRNRIISGLSQGTVIVSCRRKSGTMLTASHALAQNRDLFAVPGDIFAEFSEGPNSLLIDGAEPALSAKQIALRYVDIYKKPLAFPDSVEQSYVGKESKKEVIKPNEQKLPPPFLDEKQLLVFNGLLEGKRTVDTLADRTNLEIFQLLSVLTQLEISGVATSLPGGFYQLI